MRSTVRLLKRIVSKDCFDLPDFSDEVINALVYEAQVTPYTFFDTTARTIFLLATSDVPPQIADEMEKALDAVKQNGIDFARFIYAMNIPGVSKEAAIAAAEYFILPENMYKERDVDELSIMAFGILDIGLATCTEALSVTKWLSQKANRDLVKALSGIIPVNPCVGGAL